MWVWPVSQLSGEKIADADINTRKLSLDTVQCVATLGIQDTRCALLLELLQIATDPSLETSNIRFRDLARLWHGRKTLPSELNGIGKELLQPGISFFMIPSGTSEAMAVTHILSAHQIVHFSQWASSPLLNNVNEYPYFFRLVPSDEHQVHAIADLIEDFGFTYVSLVVGSDNDYSGQGFHLLRRESLHRGTFCLAVHQPFSADNELSIVQVVRAIENERNAKAVIVFANAREGAAFLRVFHEMNVTDHVLIGSDDWVNRVNFNAYPPGAFRSTPIFGLLPDPSQIFPDAAETLALFHRAFQSPEAVYAMATQNVYMQMYLEQEGGCIFLPAGSCSSEHADHMPNCTVALIGSVLSRHGQNSLPRPMTVLFHTVRSVLSRASPLVPVCLNGTCGVTTLTMPSLMMRDMLRTTTLPCHFRNGTTRICRVFTDGQSAYPVYQLRMLQHTTILGHYQRDMVEVAVWDEEEGENYQARLNWLPAACIKFRSPDPCINMTARRHLRVNNGSDMYDDPVPKSSCSLPCPPGFFRQFFEDRRLACCWSCVPCGKSEISSETNSDRCTACPRGLVTNVNQSSCMKPVMRKWPWSAEWSYFIITLAGINFILTGVVLAYFIRNRQHPVIKAANLPHTMLILGSALSTDIIIFVVLPLSPIQSGVLCSTERILIYTTADIPILAILMKINRVRQIFQTMHFVKRAGLQRKILSAGVQVVLILGLCAIGVIVLVIIAVVKPAYTELVFLDAQHASRLCAHSWLIRWAVFGFAWAGIALDVVLAWFARKLPDEFNESKLILFTTFVSLVLFIALAPILFQTRAILKPIAVYFLMLCFHFVVSLCLCVPRIYWCHYGMYGNGLPVKSSGSHASRTFSCERALSTVSDRRLSCQCPCHQYSKQLSRFTISTLPSRLTVTSLPVNLIAQRQIKDVQNVQHETKSLQGISSIVVYESSV